MRGRRRYRTFQGERIRIDANALRKIPKAERILLIGLWHLTNELNTLSKLILLTTGNKPKGEFEKSAKALMSLVLVKMFAAKAVEGWELFKKAQRFPEFKEKYLEHELSPDLVKAKDWLGKYFGKANVIQSVRDKFSAHYDYDLMSKGADDLVRLDSFIFLPAQQGNSLYWVAEEILLRSLKEVGKAGESVKAVYDRLLTDVSKVVTHLSTLAQLTSIIALEESGNRRQFDLSLTHKVRYRIANTADIPFFIDFSVRPKRRRKMA